MGNKTTIIKRIIAFVTAFSIIAVSAVISNETKTDAAAITLLNTYGRYFGYSGTCVTSGQLQDNTIFSQVKSHYNSITLENEMKPDYLLGWWANTMTKSEAQAQGYIVPDSNAETKYPRINFDSVDSVLKTCYENGIGVRGHTLIWHSQTPDWFFKADYNWNNGYVSKEVMNARVEYYVKNVMDHIYKSKYGSVVYSWDVVNEYLNATTSGWEHVYGKCGTSPSFVKLGFECAYEILQKYKLEDKVSLVYNDYNTYENTNNLIKLIKYINSDKKVCSGVGMQSHLAVKYPSVEKYLSTMKAFLNEGFEVQVTELDVTMENSTEAVQADYYYELMKGILNLKKGGANITGITFWGVSDETSWRSDRTPLIFSSPGKKKPAYDKVMQAFDEVVGLPESDGNMVSNGGMEEGISLWSSRGDAVVALDTKTVKSGKNSLRVSNRNGTWNGAIQDITGQLKAGTVYDVSAAFRFNLADNPQAKGETVFELSLAFGDGTFGNMATVTTGPDKWAVLNGKYTVPANADLSSVQLIVETLYTDNPVTQDLVTFYVDDVLVQEEKAAIPTIPPTKEPTKAPTKEPTKAPTKEPTKEPAMEPTTEPTSVPAGQATDKPVSTPHADVTANPTALPNIVSSPEPSLNNGQQDNNMGEDGVIKAGGYIYRVISDTPKKETVMIMGAVNKNIKNIVIRKNMVYNGITYRITGVADNAFKNNKKLTKLTVGNNITFIGKKAFYNCKKLKSIIFKTKKLKKVGKNAFKRIKKGAVIKTPKSKKSRYLSFMKK